MMFFHPFLAVREQTVRLIRDRNVSYQVAMTTTSVTLPVHRVTAAVRACMPRAAAQCVVSESHRILHLK